MDIARTGDGGDALDVRSELFHSLTDSLGSLRVSDVSNRLESDRSGSPRGHCRHTADHLAVEEAVHLQPPQYGTAWRLLKRVELGPAHRDLRRIDGVPKVVMSLVQNEDVRLQLQASNLKIDQRVES